ncbi:MAG: nucleotide exchange factor GrpE [Phycisphaerales bacterium]|nr:nucleotide exchange factor GrpE [Phycisphaerales bacterium]
MTPKDESIDTTPASDASDERDAVDAARVQALAETLAAKYDADLTLDAAAIIDRLEVERDQAIAGRQRALADYANFQRRSRENEARALTLGATGVVRSVLDVADHFELILNQAGSAMTVEQLLDGVRLVHAELMKALEGHEVVRVEPAPGDVFDPNRHEAMLRQSAEGIEPNHVVMLLQPGWAMGDVVLRPAKVSVSPGEEE